MTKEKRILIYFISFLLGFFLIMFIGISGVFAATYDTQAVTWYYRETSDESTQLNIIKDVDTPFYGVSGEYLNGFTTRQDHTFEKNLQYMITYKIRFLYYDNLDGDFRNDTIDRMISYSWVDSDFKLLNTNINQTKYECMAGICNREFTISQQVLTLNSTGGIRFGVYTTEPKSIGFYSPPSPPSVDVTLSNIITIEDNSSSTIIDQNNQIISGQDGINNNITNSTNAITSEIDEMEQSIIDSNKETQDVIKDQFNNCGSNLINKSQLSIGSINTTNGNNTNVNTRIRTDFIEIQKNIEYLYSINENYLIEYLFYYDDNYLGFMGIQNNTGKITFTNGNKIKLRIKNIDGTQLTQDDIDNLDLYFGSEEICSNKIDETNDKLDGIQGALTDTSTPNLEILGDTAGWLPPGPLDSVLNLPLTMLNNLLTNLGRTCSTFRVELPFVNKNIEIPCVESLMEQMGALVLWRWVGRIASVIILYSYLMNLYAWADKILTLRAEFDEAMGADLANWGRL